MLGLASFMQAIFNSSGAERVVDVQRRVVRHCQGGRRIAGAAHADISAAIATIGREARSRVADDCRDPRLGERVADRRGLGHSRGSRNGGQTGKQQHGSKRCPDITDSSHDESPSKVKETRLRSADASRSGIYKLSHTHFLVKCL